jgi:hypothetical protein
MSFDQKTFDRQTSGQHTESKERLVKSFSRKTFDQKIFGQHKES